MMLPRAIFDECTHVKVSEEAYEEREGRVEDAAKHGGEW